MSIRVTCRGCHTRFNVSEKFAGREGPCPKCKKTIRIPAANEEVKVHSPQHFGPKGASGEGVLKPLFRKETRISPVQLVLVFAFIVGLIAIAWMIRTGVPDKSSFSSLLLLGMSVLVAVPCVYAAYAFLRDSELGPLTGKDLWIRVTSCSAAYGLLWTAFYIANMAMFDDYGTATWVAGVSAMFVAGSLTGSMLLGLDNLTGVLHYGMYFGCCLLLRAVAGFSLLPAPVDSMNENGLTVAAVHWTINLFGFVSGV